MRSSFTIGKAVGYGAGVWAWVGGKRPSYHPGWAWVGVWPLGLGFQAGRGAGVTS
ncbi:hypothetical protein Hanom_Chr08g00743531 [Helianthus anomalus]